MQNTPLEESEDQKKINFDTNAYVGTNERSENGELVAKSSIQFGISLFNNNNFQELVLRRAKDEFQKFLKN